MRDRRQTKPQANNKSESLDQESIHRVRPMLVASHCVHYSCLLFIAPVPERKCRVGTFGSVNTPRQRIRWWYQRQPQATPTPTVVQFSQVSYQVAEGTVQTNITVTRTGPNTLPSTVDYVVNDGTATQKSDFTYASGFVVIPRRRDEQDLPSSN